MYQVALNVARNLKRQFRRTLSEVLRDGIVRLTISEGSKSD